MSNNEEQNTTQIDDAMVAKKDKNFKSILKTVLIVIILVLTADMCILLGLNKLGIVDINKKIEKIPIINNFTNEQVKEQNEVSELQNLTIQIESLEKQLQLSKADLASAVAEVEALAKENKLLEEELLKLEEKKEEDNKMTAYYSKMKPKQAAQAFNNLDAQTCADLLAGMSESTAASILDKMDSSKVVEVTKIYNPVKTKPKEDKK